MSLAPFFDRARQGAAQVLKNFDASAFEDRLAGVTVTIAFDTNAAMSAEGLAALDLTARLAARLYPRVRILPLEGDHALADELVATLRSINPGIETDGEVIGEEIVLVAGATSAPGQKAIYLGSDRWLAYVSTTGPMKFGSSVNPFGAGAAACIAMANVFRTIFAEWLEKPALDSDLTLSLLNFEVGDRAANGDLPPGANIGLVQLVGVGAIGNAFIWAASRLGGVAGSLHLIDPETIELTNLQRYVLAGMADDGASKVALAASFLSGSHLHAQPFATNWAGYVAGMGHHHYDTVAVALDTVRDRVQVQSSLPRRVVNSWTQTGDLGISRHRFGGEDACLACLYLPSGKRRNEDEIVAEELRFAPEEIMVVRSMLHFGSPVGEAMTRQIADRLGLEPDALLPFAQLPLRAFRQKAVCGNAKIRAVDGGGAEVEVPMAFQSALAGVMLAAEVVASALDDRGHALKVRTSIDLMRRISSLVTVPVRKGGTGEARCICQDEDYMAAYREKYEVS